MIVPANVYGSSHQGSGQAADVTVPGGACELMLLQDRSGQILSFHWQNASQYGLPSALESGHDLGDRFYPAEPSLYLGRLQQVLSSLSPERFSCYFWCAEQQLWFDLVVSPVLLPGTPPSQVVVAGRQISSPTNLSPLLGGKTTGIYPFFPPSSDRYQKLLTEVTWNIRRTLDLPTIWQQTVNGLGDALGVSQCVICPYEAHSPTVKVIAEYRREMLPSMLEQELVVAETPALQQAIATLQPALQLLQSSPPQTTPGFPPCCSTLAMTTCYQDHPNGLIVLYQWGDLPRQWSEPELELMQELADQVGTAIAHATLFAASQSLAAELQRANSNFLQKHQELEESRQQAEEASRLKSEFLANTSHELRTPLNGMIGFLKLIMDGMADDPEEQNEFIHEAYRSALHLLNIINDVLDIAKIEAGKLLIEMAPVNLNELLEDVQDFTHAQVQQKQLRFEIQAAPTDDEIILFGNYQRLLQVMLNLVGNAIKFTHEGGVTISVEVIKKKVVVQNQELPGMVKVRVADTGIGVSLEKQDKLFQSFSQVDGSRTRQYGGTGLGLAISQKLVEAMGGVVNFYSMGEGLGSTVTFTVPLYQEPVILLL